jgi:hypothetical protein
LKPQYYKNKQKQTNFQVNVKYFFLDQEQHSYQHHMLSVLRSIQELVSYPHCHLRSPSTVVLHKNNVGCLKKLRETQRHLFNTTWIIIQWQFRISTLVCTKSCLMMARPSEVGFQVSAVIKDTYHMDITV